MDRDFLIDLFADFGPVTIRRMFSGFGISADGTNFALALRGGLFLRADEQTIPQFEAEGSKPFQYQTRAKTVTVDSYWHLPERLYDDPEELTRMGEGGIGGGAARGSPQASQSAQGAKAATESCGSKAAAKKPASRKPRRRRRTRHPERTRARISFTPRSSPSGDLTVRRPGSGSRRRIPGRLRR